MRFFHILFGLLLIANLSGISDCSAATQKTEIATLAGGCFWCMEAPFDKLDGVESVTVGYTGGSLKSPTYKQVSAGGTGHAEVVQIVFNPAKISYSRLLETFWRNIDPTVSDRQFCDIGHQYRAAIFFHGDEQKRAALQSKKALEKSKSFKEAVITENRSGGNLLQGRGIPPELLQEKPDPLQVLPGRMRAGQTLAGAVGQRCRTVNTRGGTRNNAGKT
jgi:peptide-methionine (S)-S-oxide reductase